MTTSRTSIQLIRRRAVYTFLFFIGTVIAAIGWFAEWKNLGATISFFHYAGWIGLMGHVVQIIGVFGNLLTPDAEGEGDLPTLPKLPPETPAFWKEN